VNDTILGTPLPDGQRHNVITDHMALLQCFQVSLSVYLVDALSRVQDHLPAYFVASNQKIHNCYPGNEDLYYVQDLYDTANVSGYKIGVDGLKQADFDDAERFIEISMPLSRYGYGYGFADSRLIYVAATILLVHVTVCIAHVIWIAVTNPRGEMGWETLGELIAVLLRTPVAERGIPMLKTKGNWSRRIVVREMDGDGKSQVGESLNASDAKHVKRKASTLMLRRVPASIRE
jgi:hypothetical protein